MIINVQNTGKIYFDKIIDYLFFPFPLKCDRVPLCSDAGRILNYIRLKSDTCKFHTFLFCYNQAIFKTQLKKDALMPHAIVVFFDEEESAPINEIIKELAIQNVSTFMFEKSIPHITLAIYDELKGESSKEKLKEFALKTKPAPFVFSHIGLLGSKLKGIIAAPVVNVNLLHFHKTFHDYFSNEGKNSWESYSPDNWVPHCTLAFRVLENKIDEAFSVSKALKLPLCQLPVYQLIL